MRLPKIEISVKTVAAALAIIQGLAWTIMSLICIILYYEGPTLTTLPSSYMESVGHGIYGFFLMDRNPSFIATSFDRTFTPGVFTGFMWIYFLIDIAWIAVTVYMLSKSTAFALKLWSCLTLFICFWDFLTFVILGADYDKCLDFGRNDFVLWILGDYMITISSISIQQFCANVILPVFLIAAKGFVLWIVNIVIALLLLRTSKQITDKSLIFI